MSLRSDKSDMRDATLEDIRAGLMKLTMLHCQKLETKASMYGCDPAEYIGAAIELLLMGDRKWNKTYSLERRILYLARSIAADEKRKVSEKRRQYGEAADKAIVNFEGKPMLSPVEALLAEEIIESGPGVENLLAYVMSTKPTWRKLRTNAEAFSIVLDELGKQNLRGEEISIKRALERMELSPGDWTRATRWAKEKDQERFEHYEMLRCESVRASKRKERRRPK